MNTTAPAGWLQDPMGRHHRRYWDGSRWTEHVQTMHGATAVDPIDAPTRSSVQRSSTAATTTSMSLPGIVAAIAALVGIVACMALDWVKTRPGEDSFSSAQTMTRDDISTLISAFGGDSVNGITKSFFDVGWAVLIICVVWCAVVAFGGIAGSRSAAAVASIAAAAWTIFAVQDLTSDNGTSDTTLELQIGSYLAIAAIIAAALTVLLTKPTRARTDTAITGFAPPQS